MSLVKLHYREMGEGEPLIILHGLFGFSDNWQTHAKKLSSYFRVILVDLRNHGHSPWTNDFSYKLMAQDVIALMDSLAIEESIVVGHSMGGKVVMHMAQMDEDRISKMVVVDMGTRAYEMHHQSILAGIHAIDVDQIKVRRDADEILKEYVDSYGVRQFLLKNLYWKEKGKLAWRINVEVLEREMPEILSALPEGDIGVSSLFIRGELSNYISDAEMENIESQIYDIEFVTISNAGHWVHAEAPEAFIESLLDFCLR
jgi:pimeloyl-ACP methyl ester carboxylesterase